MVPSVKVLAVNVRLGVPSEANMVINYLNFFPNVHTLFVMSEVGELGKSSDVKFLQESIPINCLQTTLKKVVFKNFQGKDTEFTFLKFIWVRAKVLKKMLISLADGIGGPVLPLVIGKLQAEFCTKHFTPRKSALILYVRGYTLEITSNISMCDSFDI